MFVNNGHNHDQCIKNSMKRAVNLCASRGVRLTALRSRVLELILQSHHPVGAYDLLNLLRNERQNAQPPTIYRALNFLLDLGLVHKVKSLNAYIGCYASDTSHNSQFLICIDCGAAAEITDIRIDNAINALAKAANFSVNNRSIEVEGKCPNCQGS
ncbi:MAG: Fur family transcriptional regulator [Magnetovibrio sp.]|nr:Fur family transcriptional regulator [Magnetovibrio sp.]|tara:strand:+ start:9310 stop:9777 length:468 start_codon:yes stop_codon:yes gene_type:complete